MDVPGRVALTLYVVGQHEPSKRAEGRLRAMLDAVAGLDYDLELVDLAQDPERAEQDRILACPTVVKSWPEPRRRIVGDLSAPDLVREAIGLA